MRYVYNCESLGSGNPVSHFYEHLARLFTSNRSGACGPMVSSLPLLTFSRACINLAMVLAEPAYTVSVQRRLVWCARLVAVMSKNIWQPGRSRLQFLLPRSVQQQLFMFAIACRKFQGWQMLGICC